MKITKIDKKFIKNNNFNLFSSDTIFEFDLDSINNKFNVLNKSTLIYLYSNKIINNSNFKPIFSYKKLNYEVKKELIKKALFDFECDNTTLIINIINLLKNYNSLSDDFFSHNLVIFNDIVEFLNIKTDLQNELALFNTKLCKWYISLFFSLHKLEPSYLDDVKEMPKIFENVILSLDFITLSGICAKLNKLNTDELFIVKNAIYYIDILSQKNKLVTDLEYKILSQTV